MLDRPLEVDLPCDRRRVRVGQRVAVDVVAGAAVQRVAALSALDDVVAGVAGKRVVAAETIQNVVGATTKAWSLRVTYPAKSPPKGRS